MRLKLPVKYVSSRAPVWGASWSPKKGDTIALEVSSRAPVWGASTDQLYDYVEQNVSSRAPVWGASEVGLHIL